MTEPIDHDAKFDAALKTLADAATSSLAEVARLAKEGSGSHKATDRVRLAGEALLHLADQAHADEAWLFKLYRLAEEAARD